MASDRTMDVSFGDVVCLSEGMAMGYIAADSDISSAVFVNRQEQFQPGATIHNVGYACFTIIQKLQYSASKAFEKHLRGAQHSSAGVELTQKNWHKVLSPHDNLHRELRTLEQKIRDEMMTNKMEFQRKLGEPVVYGSVVQLKHKNSSKYLTQFKNRSEVDKLAMEVSLTANGSEGSWWQVLPAEKLRRMGEHVRYQDKILLENVKFSNSFLFVYTAKSLATSEDDCVNSPGRFEVNASSSVSSFQICHFATHEEIQLLEQESRSDVARNHLFGLGAITLYNREYDTYLCGDLEGTNVSWQATSNITDESSGKVAPGALWSVVLFKMDGGGHRIPRNNSPTVLIQHVASGHYLAKREQSVALLAQFSGRVLQDCKWRLRAHADSREEGESALVDGNMVWLEMANEHQSEVFSWLACLPVDAHSCDLKAKSSALMSAHTMTMQTASSIGLEWSMEGRTQPVLRTGMHPDNTDVMELRVQAQRQVGEVRFFLRCKQLVKLMADVLGELAPVPDVEQDTGRSLTDDQMLELTKAHPLWRVVKSHLEVYEACISSLILRCVQSKEGDPLTREGPPDPRQQELLREMGLLHQLVALMRTLSERLRVPLSVLKRVPELFKVCRLAYKLLQVACVAHSENKKSLLEHMPFFHSQMTGELGAYFVGLEVYRGTRELLLNLSDTIFDSCMVALTRWPFARPRMLELMIETCQCNDEPIRRNQDRWARLLFAGSHDGRRESIREDMVEDSTQPLLLHVAVTASDVKLVDPFGRFESMSMVQLTRNNPDETFENLDINQAKDDERRVLFYLRTLDLLAVLVLGRNAKAASLLAANEKDLGVTYENLMDMIFNADLPYFLRGRACKLMHRLHIDHDPLRPINSIRTTRIWSKLLKNPDETYADRRRLVVVDMDKGNEHNIEIARFKGLVNELPRLMATFTQTDVEEKQRNSFVGGVVRLLHEMLRLGVYHFFCPYEQELVADLPLMREIAVPIFQMLDGRTDFCAPIGELGQDSRFEVTDRSAIVTQTKAILVDTLSMLLQCVQNKRITLLVKFWERVLADKLGISKWEDARHWFCPDEIVRNESSPDPVAGGGGPVGFSFSGSLRSLRQGSNGGSFLRAGGSGSSFKGSQSGAVSPKTRQTMGEAGATMKRRLNKMMSAIALGQTRHDAAPVERYSIDPTLWKTNPPWEDNDITQLASELFKQVHLLPEMSIDVLKKMFDPGMGWFIPTWIKIVLDLLRYKDALLKERAIKVLMDSFSQQPNFIQMVKDTYLLVTPSLVELYYSVRLRTAGLQRHARDLGRDGDVGRAAAKECMVVLEDWNRGFGSPVNTVESCSGTEMPRPTGELDLASLREIQRISADLEAHVAVLIIIKKLEVENTRPMSAEWSSTLRKASQMALNIPASSTMTDHGKVQNFVSMSPSNANGVTGQMAFNSMLGNAELVEVVKIGYFFLRKFCQNNERNQELLLPYLPLFLSHAEVDGLHVEALLVEMVRDNMKVAKEVGTLLVYTCFDAITRSWNDRSYNGAGWLEVLCQVVSCQRKAMKTSQTLMIHLFGKNQLEMEEMLMGDELGWDMRIELMKKEEVNLDSFDPALLDQSSKLDSSKLAYHLGLVKLLTVSSHGKSPAAEVFAANYFPISSVFRVLTKLHISSDGVAHDLPAATVWKVKSYFVDLLRTVYVETGVKRLMEELRNETCGLWAVDSAEEDAGQRPWMEVVVEEVAQFVDMLRATDGNMAELDIPLRDFMLGSLVPLLGIYYRRQYKLVRSSTEKDSEISDALFASFQEVHRMRLPAKVWEVSLDGRKVDGSEQVWFLLHSMSTKSGIHAEWDKTPSNKTHSSWLHTSREQPAVAETAATSNSIMHIKSTFKQGFEALYETLATSLGISDTTRLIGVGLRQMAIMLSREGPVPLYESADYIPLGRSTPPNPGYHDFIVAILDSTREQATSPKILIDIMRIMRAAIYVDEPGNSDQGAAHGEEQWKAFLEDKVVEKSTEPQEEILQWVQRKFDILGCTVAALRLMSHPSEAVQNSAVRLLITLLQGGNREVQKTIYKYLTSGQKGAGFFEATMEALNSAQTALKEFRKNIKRHKAAGISIAGGLTTTRSGTASIDAVPETQGANGTGMANLGEDAMDGELTKGGHVMLVLRMVQLVCEGQFQPTQDLLQVQTAAGTAHNIIRKMVDVLEALQPLLTDAVSLGDGHLMCLGMQLIETLSEAVQGPHRSNQQALVNSNFLVVANRIFSSMVYTTDGSPAIKLVIGNSVVTDNDMRSFFKLSLLNCCLAMLEAVNSPAYPVQFLSFFELRNIILQMETIGRFLGKVGPHETTVKERNAETDELNDLKGGASIFSTVGGAGASSIRPGTTRQPRGGGTGRTQSPDSSSALVDLFSAGAEETLTNELFAYSFMLRTLLDYDSKGFVQAAMDSIAQDLPGLSSVLEERSSNVEVVRQDPELGERRVELLHFKVSEGMLELTRSKGFQESTEQAMFDVPRSNPQEKATQFLIQIKQVLDQLIWLQFVSRNSYRRFMIRNRDVFDVAPLWCSVAITIALLVLYGIPVDPNTGEILAGGVFRTPKEKQPPGYTNGPYEFADKTSDPFDVGSELGSIFAASDLSLKFRLRLTSRWMNEEEWAVWPPARHMVWAMASLHLFLTITMSANYLVHDLPMVLKQAMDMAKRKAPKREEAPANEVARTSAPPARSRRMSLVGGGDSKPKQSTLLHRMPPVPQVEDRSDYSYISLCLLKRAGTGLYLMGLCIMSLLGVMDSPLFFVFSLLDFFRRRSGLLVLRAVILAGPNLLRSLVLGMIVIICFGFYSYAYFSNIVNYEQELCHSPFQCVSKHVLDSLTGDLSTVLGDSLGQAYFPPMVVWVDSWASWKSFVLFVSIVFWVLLLKGIIQGQIIDAFAEKRNNDNALREDLETKCFVSSIDRFVFNNYPGEWEKRRGGKYAWNYLLFFTYLAEKDAEEFNGLENFVTEQMSEDKIDFLPVNTFFAQQRSEVSRGWEDKSGETALKSMRQQVAKIETDVDDVRDLLNKIVSLLRWNRAVGPGGGGGGHGHSPASPWDQLLHNAANRHL